MSFLSIGDRKKLYRGNIMSRLTKRRREMVKKVEKSRFYTFQEAIDILKEAPPAKFDQTLELSFKLGIDPRKSDQMVRGTVSLPSGTGKNVRVLVIAKGDKVTDALDAGADFAGAEDLLEKIKSGWTDFDALVTTPDMMREVGKLGKILGPRGLMPTPKAGTVTGDIKKAVQEIKSGKIEFKSDRYGIINCGVGKLSFQNEGLLSNIRALVVQIARLKPQTAKGVFFQSLFLSSTMGPGIPIDPREFELIQRGEKA